MPTATPGLPPEFPDADDVTGWTLVRAHHAVARAFVAALAEAGLTPTQYGVLMNLVSAPPESQAELARRVLLTPQSVGELLVTLERAGLVERVAPARRGAPISVRVTDAGRASLERAAPLVGRLNAPAALGLEPAEAAELNRLLHKVRTALGG